LRLSDRPDWQYLLREFQEFYRRGKAGGSEKIRSHQRAVRTAIGRILDALKAQGIEGNVVVMIRIGPNGKVEGVRILKSSGHAELDAAARKAAKTESFSPAKRNGEPVDYDLKYTYRFRIKTT
jgi:TonB family protein